MKNSLKTGFSFGLTSGVITTLGLMVGLHSGSHSRSIVIGGILTIAIADAFSDALGIHISEEAKAGSTTREIWEATFSTFIAKLLFALSFVLPVLFFPLFVAVIISIGWGIMLLGLYSFYIAKEQNSNPLHVILEHLLIASIVIIATHFVGDWIHESFN